MSEMERAEFQLNLFELKALREKVGELRAQLAARDAEIAQLKGEVKVESEPEVKVESEPKAERKYGRLIEAMDTLYANSTGAQKEWIDNNWKSILDGMVERGEEMIQG